MLTRLKVDGFKNLLGVDVAFGPYTCVVGPNGVGKSNLFDAIRFLSLLADHPIMRAAELVRIAGGRPQDPRGLFWSGTPEGNEPRMAFEVEMIVPPEVDDDIGRTGTVTSTFLKYELELAYVAPDDASFGFGRIELRREALTYVPTGEAAAHLRFPHAAKAFRDAVVVNARRGAGFISTEVGAPGKEGGAGEPTIRIHQDGGSRGQPKEAARKAQSTVVGSMSDAGTPTVLAARREFQRWRTLALEPSALRAPAEMSAGTAGRTLAENGHDLPYVLYRLAWPGAPRSVPEAERRAWSEAHAARVYARVTSRLAQLVGVAGVRVDRDDRRGLLTVQVQEERGGPYRDARHISDGTLRFLALAVIEQDPGISGLLCMEEPENGIHPQRVRPMVDLVRSLAVDASEAPGEENPLRQVVVNTHSLTFLGLHDHADEVLFAEPRLVRRDGVPARTVQFRPVAGTWRDPAGTAGVTVQYILNYLDVHVGEQVPLVRVGAA